MLARAIERAPEGKRSGEAVRIATALIHRLRSLTDGRGDLWGDEPVDPGRVLVSLLQPLPDGRPQSIERPLTPLLDTTMLTNAPGEPDDPARARSPRSRRRTHRHCHGVRPLERRPPADGRAPAPLRGEASPFACPDDDLHEQHRGSGARRSSAASARDQGLLRHDDDAAAREGVDVPPPRAATRPRTSARRTSRTRRR